MDGQTINTNPMKHTARISARWSMYRRTGSEVLEVEIPRPLTELIGPHRLKHAGAMRDALMDDAGGVELSIYRWGKTSARDYILRAARMLRLLAHTGMRPATPGEEEYVRTLLNGMLGQHASIASVLMRVNTGTGGPWVAAVTKLSELGEARAEWCRYRGITLLPPGWSNVWAPDIDPPHIFCNDQATATAFAESMNVLNAAGRLVWRGAATTRTTMTRMAKAADAALLRPKHSMALERHVEVAEILTALCVSQIPPPVAKSIRNARRVLVEWLVQEHPRADCGAIYPRRGNADKVIIDRAWQIAAVDRAMAILEGGYRRSQQRDALVRDLRRARAWVTMARAPRGRSPERKAA
jgi:hypothetical protein